MEAKPSLISAKVEARPRPRGRRRLLILVVILACMGILGALLRSYLTSQHVADQIATRLAAAYGGPVLLDKASVGVVGSSTLAGVRLFEPDGQTSDDPWIVIEHAQADVSLWNLLGGGDAMPRKVTLNGAAITLRFDKAGHLATRLPKVKGEPEALPSFRIEHGQFTLRQEGHPDLVVTGVDAKIHAEGDGLVLSGTASDSYWGDWLLDGFLNQKAGITSITLKTAHVHVTQAILDQLPFVPAKVWQQVQCEGDTSVELTVTYSPTARKAHYRIVLEPEATKVHVTSIDLHADQARGKVIIEDNLVRLTNVRGRTAEGEIKTDADLDFRTKPTEMHFKAHVDRLDISQLPKRWKVPTQIGGRLSGQADLQVEIIDGKARPTGDGQGVITEARVLGGVPVIKPIRLKLHADGTRFRFSSRRPASHERQPLLLAPAVPTVGLSVLYTLAFL